MLSVVMPTYNNAQCLELTLRSLTRQTLSPEEFEVIVVQDGRMNGYDGIERHAPDINLRMEVLPQRRGRSVARNAGLALAKGEVVLFLDSDCYAVPELFARHYAFHDGQSARRVLLGNRYEIDWQHMGYLIRDEPVPAELLASDDYRDVKFHGAPDEEIPLCLQTPWLFAHTNNASVTADTLAAAGGFNEDFGLKWGFEDLELFYRIYVHLGRAAEAFSHDAAAASYHLVEYRNQRGFYQEMFENVGLLRRLHPNVDWEFHSLLSPTDIAAKVRHYRAVIDRCVSTGVGYLPPVWSWLESRIGATDRLLVVGTGTEDVPLPDGTVTFDYKAPPSPSNFHLVGVSIPTSIRELDTVVSVDFWRCLPWHDLCDFLRETTRVASRTLLVHTRKADVAHDAMKTAGEIGYFLRALEGRFHLSVERGADGVTGITVRQRTA